MNENDKDYEKAIADYGEAIRLDSSDAAAHSGRAECYLRLGNAYPAIRDFEKACELDSYGALADFENTISFDRWHPFKRTYESEALRDPYYWLVDFLQQSLAFQDQVIKAHVELGDIYSSMLSMEPEPEDGEEYDYPISPEGVEEQYDNALAVTPVDARDWYYRSEAFSRKGDEANAVECCSTAIELDPEFAPPYCDRALHRMKENDFQGAKADLDEAARIRPDIDAYRYFRGVALMGIFDYSEAIDEFDAVIAFGDFTDSYFERARERKAECRDALANSPS